jgi:hypothetical protein
VHKARNIVLGIIIGLLVETGSLVSAFSGTNLFHGGQPNTIANALLPAIGIVDHLPDTIPPIVPKILLVISLLQFPVYGVLAGLDLSNKSLSRLSLGIILLHLSGSALAFYGMALDKHWHSESERYGDCIRNNPSAEELTDNSSRIIALLTWIEQSENQLSILRMKKRSGAVLSPDPEPSLIKNLDNERNELEQRWKFYREAGGPAKSPGKVSIIPGPCGKPPSRPTLF